MKKLSLLTAAMLCCSLASAQEAEGDQILIVPRFDVNPVVPVGSDGHKGFNFSNSSLYTVIEGGIGSTDITYSVENHWLAVDPASLYRNTLHSDNSSWLDWAYLTYSLGSFDFTVGKKGLAVGGYENEDYDFDSHIDLNSTFWNNFVFYQWGGSLGWTSKDESTRLDLQVATSPYGVRPFASGLYAYSLKWSGDYGPYSSRWSVNSFDAGDGESVYMAVFGNNVAIGDFNVGVDYIARGYSGANPFGQEGSVLATLDYSPLDNLTIRLKGGYEYCNGDDVLGYEDEEDPLMEDWFVPCSLQTAKSIRGTDYMFGGLAIQYYPTDAIRLHTVIAYNNWSRALSINVGAIYYLNLKPLLFK